MPPAGSGPGKPGRSFLKLIVIALIVILVLPFLVYGVFLGAILYDSWMHGGPRWN